MRAVLVTYSVGPKTLQRFFKSRKAAIAWLRMFDYTLATWNSGDIITDADGQLIWLGDNQFSMPLTMP